MSKNNNTSKFSTSDQAASTTYTALHDIRNPLACSLGLDDKPTLRLAYLHRGQLKSCRYSSICILAQVCNPRRSVACHCAYQGLLTGPPKRCFHWAARRTLSSRIHNPEYQVRKLFSPSPHSSAPSPSPILTIVLYPESNRGLCSWDRTFIWLSLHHMTAHGSPFPAESSHHVFSAARETKISLLA